MDGVRKAEMSREGDVVKERGRRGICYQQGLEVASGMDEGDVLDGVGMGGKERLTEKQSL